MTNNYEREPNLVCEILTGEMQDRYAESGILQVHPNYMQNTEFAIYGTPKQTRLCVQSAYLLRWAGVNGRDLATINQEAAVPSLVDIRGEEVAYQELQPEKTFDFLRAIDLIEATDEMVRPTAGVRKILTVKPEQVFTVLPPKKGWRVIFSPGIRDAARANQLYTEALYGPDAHIPLGRTDSTPAIDKRRRNMKLIRGGDEKN